MAYKMPITKDAKHPRASVFYMPYSPSAYVLKVHYHIFFVSEIENIR